jgi:hypothetical protein
MTPTAVRKNVAIDSIRYCTITQCHWITEYNAVTSRVLLQCMSKLIVQTRSWQAKLVSTSPKVNFYLYLKVIIG